VLRYGPVRARLGQYGNPVSILVTGSAMVFKIPADYQQCSGSEKRHSTRKTDAEQNKFLFPTTSRGPRLIRNKGPECRSARLDPYIQGPSVERLHNETRHRLPRFECMAGRRKRRAYRTDKQTLTVDIAYFQCFDWTNPSKECSGGRLRRFCE